MYSGLGTYYLKNGQVASVLYVGDTMGFTVPGYSKVWLDQIQNGATQFSGPFNLPMAPYVLQDRDKGTFQATVSELTPAGTKGKLIGTDSIQVLAAIVQPTFAPPVIQQTLAPGYSNPTATPGGTAILSTGVATPSTPAPAQMLFSPSVSYAPATMETPAAAEPIPAAGEGFPTGLLLIAGVGLLFLFSGRGRR